MLTRFLLVLMSLGIALAGPGAVQAQESAEPMAAITLDEASIPFFRVFAGFLMAAESFYENRSGTYEGYLIQMGVDPDLPIAIELAGEHAKIFEELNSMDPGTGDQRLDNEIRDDRYAVLLGEVYGRLLKEIREASPSPDQAEAIFYGRLNERTRRSMSVTYLDRVPDADRIEQRQRAFEAADTQARLATNR